MMDEGKLTNRWKIIAILFIILFLVENLFIVWTYYVGLQEENKVIDCYYDICGDYPEAYYESDVCICYDYDVMGELVIAKTEIIR